MKRHYNEDDCMLKRHYDVDDCMKRHYDVDDCMLKPVMKITSFKSQIYFDTWWKKHGS
jgi:hypothetical protein